MQHNNKIFLENLPLSRAFLLGFTAMAAQIILIREFLLLFYGNELVIGLLIALWLALTALGVLLGKKITLHISTDILLVVFSFIPLLLLLFMELFRNTIFLYGRMPGLYEILLYATAVLTFFCLPNGILFSMLNRQVLLFKKDFRKIYALEAVGSLSGGLLVSLLFVAILSMNPFTTWIYLLIFNWTVLSISLFMQKKKSNAVLLLFVIVLLGFLSSQVNLNRFGKTALFKGQRLISSTETPLGNITVTGSGTQTNVYSNGQLVSSSEEFAEKEEAVHFTLLQRPKVKTVLQIGGGLEGITPEILKYKSIKKIVHLELSSLFFDTLCKSKKVTQLALDPVLLLRNEPGKFDAILQLEPPPENAEMNRFYTVDFFKKVKRRLSKNGIFSFRLPASENYLDSQELLLHSILYNSLHLVFKNVVIIPGRKNYFLASDSTLSTDYARLYKNAGIRNRYVNPNYIKDRLLQFRSQQIQHQLITGAPVNRDFKPVAYLSSLKHWLNYYGNSFQWLPLALTMAVLLFLLISPGSNYLFSTGFAGVSMEIVFLLIFQVLFGYLYLFLGIMISLFMAGLAAGSLQTKIFNRQPVLNFFSLILILLISVPFLMLLKNFASPNLLKAGLLVLLFLFAFFSGNQYRILIAGAKRAETVANIYSSDLAGAMLGGFITVIWFLPKYGIINTLWINIFLLFLTLVIAFLKRKLTIFRG